MAHPTALEAIDSEISRLQQVRRLMSETEAGSLKPKAVNKAAGVKQATPAGPAKRVMSPEGRQRIADAQKKRWAKQKKA